MIVPEYGAYPLSPNPKNVVFIKECKDIKEPNKVKSLQPVIFHFQMSKVRNADREDH